jgi:predicted GH43/DUF377 family glycosyl hydrolase
MPPFDAVTPASARLRLLSRGDLPGSDGGLYNPGAVGVGDRLELIVRREIDYRFTTNAHAERVVLDAADLSLIEHRTLARRGYPDDARIEDFRPVRFRGETLVVHTMVRPGGIRPVLARATESEIELLGAIELPWTSTPIEKNWVLFVHEDELHCLYRLDPLLVFARGRRGRWQLRKRVDNGWGDRFPAMLSNSANLVPFDGGHLGFWHSVVDGRYVQGALLLDDRLDLACATGVLLDGRDAAPGHKRGVLYVSALVAQEHRVLAFYGEGDAHSGVAVFDARTLAAALRRRPFVPADPVTARVAPATMGELFHAMVALDEVAQSAGARPLWVEAPPPVHEVVSRFGVPGLALRDLSGRERVDYAFGSAAADAAMRRRRRSKA